MAKKAKVTTHLDHVMLRVKDATDEVLHAIALQVEGTAKRNIVDNDQVDTGFMLNSTYTESKVGSTFGGTWGTGTYEAKKTGGMKDVDKAPRIQLPRAFSAAAIHVSAVYAIYQEIMNSFLRTAVEEVAGQVKGIADPVYKRALHD